MFINKFNKLIRNKWIWGIFAVIVCFLFVASDMFRGDGGSRDNALGHLDGDPVAYDEYQLATLAVRVGDLLANRGMSRMEASEAEARAWRFVAAARTARKMGLQVSDAELKAHIKMLFCDETGAFRLDFYNRFVMDQFQSSTSQFEAADKVYLLVQKVSTAFALANWTSAPLTEAQSRGLTDTYTLQTVSVSNTFGNAEVEVSEEKLQAYYERNKALYVVPDQVSVRYVTFKVADFADKVPEADEDDLRFRYDENPARFTEEVDGVKTNLSFEAAREKLVAEYKAEKAVDLAKLAAGDFAEAFYNDGRDREREAEILAPGFFEATAAAQNLAVATTGLFSASAVPGIAVSDRAAFSEAAFELGPNASYDYYSDAVAGKELVYVLAFGEKVEEHEPGLEAVKAKVQKAVVEEERANLFSDNLSKLYENYTAEIGKGRAFEEVAAELGFSVSTNMVVAPMDPRALPGSPYQWISVLPRVGIGEDSQFVPYDDGAAFVHVTERKAGDDTMLSYYKANLSDKMRGAFAANLSENWLESNFKGMNPDIPSLEVEE